MVKMVTISLFCASFSTFYPGLAFARNGEGVTNKPVQVQHLITIPGATNQMLQGRTAERATLQPTLSLSDPETEYAGSDIAAPDYASN